MLPQNLRNKKIIIVTYEATTGPAHDLRDFLVDKSKQLLFIAHPLLFIPANFNKSSYWEMYRNGKKIQQGRAFHFILPEIILYLKDFIYSLIWTLTKMQRSDLYFGVGNINALVGIILKKIGLTQKVIFYCIDYIPQRFS